ncbi:hypothetical protein PMAYCL1PPCAC_07869, partial [Pristionchus mayeri]
SDLNGHEEYEEANGYGQKQTNKIEKPDIKARAEAPRPVDIVLITQEVIGSSPINGKTGLVQKRLHELCKGRPLSIDSSKTAVRLASWDDEADKSRLETLFQYALCEAFNYNAAVMSDQCAKQREAMRNLEGSLGSLKNKNVIMPDMPTELSLLKQDKLEIERPGYPGDIIDMRDIASKVHLTASSITDRWRQMAREILDAVLKKEVQCVYSAATKASMYFPLPQEFIDAIVECCTIASDLNEADSASHYNTITTHVRTSLGFKLNEIKKGKSKDIEVLVRDAVAAGWTPPGVSREEACEMYGQASSSAASTVQSDLHESEDIFKEEDDTWGDPTYTANVTAKVTPTSHLKRRGPCGIKYNEAKRGKPVFTNESEGSAETLRSALGAHPQPDLVAMRRAEDSLSFPPNSNSYYNLRQ